MHKCSLHTVFEKRNALICLYFETGTLLWLFGTTKDREYNVSLQQLENYWESGILSSKVISLKLHSKVLIYQCQKITTQQMNNVIGRNIKRSLTK